MTIGYCLQASPQHSSPGHPESPSRFDRFPEFIATAQQEGLVSIEHEPAPQADLLRVHTQAYLDSLEQACRRGAGFLDADTYVNQHSFAAAQEAAGAGLRLVEALADASIEQGLALIRPPGHHATANMPGGFCLLNNIAVAARRAQALGFGKVMIVDFDVHHGNGTEAIFAEDADIYYLSTHQWGIYPGTGPWSFTGSGPGKGSVLNVPLPAGAGDRAFALIGEQLILPAAKRFQPEIVLVSAGFDAHWRDPLASLQLTIGGYYSLARLLVDLAVSNCQGRMVYFLEGGYDPEVLANGLLAVVTATAGAELAEDTIGPARRPEPNIQPLLDQLREMHAF